MSLLSTFRSFFGGDSAPRLRNKPGGMAWIRGVPSDYGAEALNGRIVKTVRVNENGAWDIEPAQFYTSTAHGTLFPSGLLLWPGKVLRQTGINDEHLEPITDRGITSEEVEQLYLPSPTKTTEAA